MRPEIHRERTGAHGAYPVLKGKKIGLVATVPYHLVNQLKHQAEFLRDIGMAVTLISSGGPEVSKIETGPRLRYEIIDIPRSLSFIRDILALFKLYRVFLKYRFDIVHSTTPKGGLLTALSAFAARMPIRLHTFTGQRWITLKGWLRQASRMADRLIGILDTKCYADSQGQAKFLVSEGIITPRKIAVIGPGSLAGVDLDRFEPGNYPWLLKQQLRKSLSIAASSKVILFVGRITSDKGIGELISAFQRLLGLNYETDLILAGPQDKDCGGNCSLDLNIGSPCPRVHYVGNTNYPEKYMAISDIFCLPSYREGFGTVVIEAAAAGLPTVGTAIYGLADTIIDGETGILIPPRDNGALLEALIRLLDNPDELKKMGRAAKKRCYEIFDANKINERVVEEYARLLGAKTTRNY